MIHKYVYWAVETYPPVNGVVAIGVVEPHNDQFSVQLGPMFDTELSHETQVDVGNSVWIVVNHHIGVVEVDERRRRTSPSCSYTFRGDEEYFVGSLEGAFDVPSPVSGDLVGLLEVDIDDEVVMPGEQLDKPLDDFEVSRTVV